MVLVVPGDPRARQDMLGFERGTFVRSPPMIAFQLTDGDAVGRRDHTACSIKLGTHWRGEKEMAEKE